MKCKQCKKEALMLFPSGLCTSCAKSVVLIRPKAENGTSPRYEYMRERRKKLIADGVKPKSNAEAMRRYRARVKLAKKGLIE